MKHLKTFETHSINEEEGLKKFFTGYDSKEEKESAKQEFYKALEEAKAKVSEDPNKYSFNEKALIKKAESDNFKGGLRIQKGGRSNKVYVVYDKGVTGFDKVASGGGNARDLNIR